MCHAAHNCGATVQCTYTNLENLVISIKHTFRNYELTVCDVLLLHTCVGKRMTDVFALNCDNRNG
jgi:hypothetical protein